MKKKLLMYFSLPIIIVVCLLLGQKFPSFNAIGVVLIILSIIGVIGSLIWVGIEALIKRIRK